MNISADMIKLSNLSHPVQDGTRYFPSIRWVRITLSNPESFRDKIAIFQTLPA